MEERNRKQVKVQGKFRESQSRLMFKRGSNKIVPWLTVSGLWLAKLGFNVGDMVNITMDNNKIIIEPAEKNPSVMNEVA
ncbi:Toxin SymE, type I toxin-antitoxin system [Arachidicoccus rhizosphaerae]|uniref:Toxin SymE, type I toxin-antitoxin system n=1 Tax=Arachidicoccus rhizosphaerae TaxID=551991 RepID=A0A1H3YS95_9BACT|nr:SymE family type I addiction module toxin [Arachidicoccus rhizosphaerae]SEA14429.1 Toxin SymE, type I toxin-antitoxin system [Arachidicoccus rhizosphaerae]